MKPEKKKKKDNAKLWTLNPQHHHRNSNKSKMNNQALNLLDKALGLEQQSESWPLSGRVLLIEDYVETSGSFVLHQLVKRALSSNSSNVIIFIALSNSFSHYDRILRKLVSIRACIPLFVWVLIKNVF